MTLTVLFYLFFFIKNSYVCFLLNLYLLKPILKLGFQWLIWISSLNLTLLVLTTYFHTLLWLFRLNVCFSNWLIYIKVLGSMYEQSVFPSYELRLIFLWFSLEMVGIITKIVLVQFNGCIIRAGLKRVKTNKNLQNNFKEDKFPVKKFFTRVFA